MSTGAKLAVAAGVALVGAAVLTELRKPAGTRDWHGRIAGALPYDFRPPAPARIRAALWDPASDQLFTPHAFGVGWSLNFARLARLSGPRRAVPRTHP